MGLSAADKARVTSDWAKVVPDTDAHGVGFYQKLLGENPQYSGKFQFSDVAVADFPGNQKVLVQARKTFKAVDQCVGWVDSPAEMQKRMARLAGTHKGYGVGMADFDVGFGVLLGYLSGALALDDSGVTAWKNFTGEMRAALASNY